MIDESGRIGYVNDALAGILGYSAAPLTGEPLLRLIPERLRGAHQAGLSRYLQTGRRGIPWQGVELAALHRDGHEVPVEVSFSEFAHGGRRYFVGFLRDITERRAAEAVLEQSRQAVVRAQEEKQLFYAEVIRAVTGERLSLVDPARLPVEGQPALEVDLTYPAGCTELRRGLEGIARASGMPEDAAADLIAAAGEAASNAVKHAHDGVAAVFTTSDRIVVRVSDRGPGIRAENLPATILLPGFSTAVSLGMGYTMMLNLADHVWLSTGPQGTIVQMDRRIRPGDAEDGFLRAALERLGRE